VPSAFISKPSPCPIPVPVSLPPFVETVLNDVCPLDALPPLCPRLSSSSDDDSLLDLFTIENDFGINSIGLTLPSLTSTDDVIIDDNFAPDSALDVHEEDYCHIPPCCCCSETSNPSAIDHFLTAAAVATPNNLYQDQVLHQLYNDAGDIHELVINEIRHNDFEGPRAHLDDGAQARTTHVKEHLFAYRTFTKELPCRTRLVSADGHRYVPLGYGVLRVPAPNSIGYVPIFCFIPPKSPPVSSLLQRSNG
jgi:hypothetical protein